MGRPKIDDVMSCATTGSAPPAYLIDGLYVRYLHSFFLSSSLSPLSPFYCFPLLLLRQQEWHNLLENREHWSPLVTRDSVSARFQEMKLYIDTTDLTVLKSDKIYNADESGFRNCPKTKQAYATMVLRISTLSPVTRGSKSGSWLASQL